MIYNTFGLAFLIPIPLALLVFLLVAAVCIPILVSDIIYLVKRKKNKKGV